MSEKIPGSRETAEQISDRSDHHDLDYDRREASEIRERHQEIQKVGTTKEAIETAKQLAKETDDGSSLRELSPAERRRPAPSKNQRARVYKSTLHDLQQDMSTTERVTSKIIHNPVIEKSSDVISSTVARPNALLAGSVSAFICVTIVYFFAKNYGYQLSGFETIAFFIAGWLLGMLYDYLRVLTKRRRS